MLADGVEVESSQVDDLLPFFSKTEKISNLKLDVFHAERASGRADEERNAALFLSRKHCCHPFVISVHFEYLHALLDLQIVFRDQDFLK